MLEYRMKGVSSCGLFCLILGLACESDGGATFSDVESANPDDSFAVRAGGSGSGRAPGRAGGSTDTPAPAADAGASGSIELPPDVSVAPTGTLFCGAEPCQCNNGIDDDGDGTSDGFDVECTGAIDDDEGSFATGIPGDNRDPKWQDCFFDGNSGAGDDRCRYPTECLTGELSLDAAACAVTQACRDNCQPRTPNGCDCFGCCAVALPGGGRVDVLIGPSCSVEQIGDTEACPACIPNPECSAPPVGEDPDPSDPGEPNPPDAGDPGAACQGRTPCTESSDCGGGEFCSLGCCLVSIK